MTQLSKHSQRNLMVIENFILHYTHGEEHPDYEEMMQSAKDYISEDHVDGEDSEEAQAEHSDHNDSINKARKILCEDADGSKDLIENITNQVKLIVEANKVNPDGLIDYVDNVIVWEKVALEFTCIEFLYEIDWQE